MSSLSSNSRLLLHAGRSADVVNLEDHFDELGGQLELRLLGVERLDDGLLLHVAGPRHLHAIDAQGWVVLRYLKKEG